MDYMTSFGLTGKRAVVTGAGRGIGFEIANALAQAGAEIVIAEKDEKGASAAAAKLTENGFQASYTAIDITESGAVTALADRLNVERPIDILVNNAGFGRQANALETSDEDWLATMQLNSDAAFWCSRAFGRHMVARRSGAIVNIGSMCGMIVTQPQNNTAYAVSKGAVHMMTKSLACAWARNNVRVNAVAPGYVATEALDPLKAEHPDWYEKWKEQTPMGRLATPQEIASTVLFLASPAASYCTGVIMSVDGGYTCF